MATPMSFSTNIVNSDPTPAHDGSRGGRGGGRAGKFVPPRTSPPYPPSDLRGRCAGLGRGFDFRRGGSFNNNSDASIVLLSNAAEAIQNPIANASGALCSQPNGPVPSTSVSNFFNPQAESFESNDISQRHHIVCRSAPLNAPQAPRFFRNHIPRNQQSRKAFHNGKRNENTQYLGFHASWHGSDYAQEGPGFSNRAYIRADYSANGQPGRANFPPGREWENRVGFCTNEVDFAGNRADEYRTSEWAPGFNYALPAALPFGFDFNEQSLVTDPAGNVVVCYGAPRPIDYVSWNSSSFPQPPSTFHGRFSGPYADFNVDAPVFIPAAVSAGGQCCRDLATDALPRTFQTLSLATPSIDAGGTNDRASTPQHHANLTPASHDPLQFGPGSEPLDQSPLILGSARDLEGGMDSVTLGNVPMCAEGLTDRRANSRPSWAGARSR